MSEVVLRTEGLSKSYPGVKALDDVSIEVRAREVVGLIGENGAGKSTLIKVLAGLQRPDSGRIVVRVIRPVLPLVVAVVADVELAEGDGDRFEGGLIASGSAPDQVQQRPQALGERQPLRLQPHQPLRDDDSERRRRTSVGGQHPHPHLLAQSLPILHINPRMPTPARHHRSLRPGTVPRSNDTLDIRPVPVRTASSVLTIDHRRAWHAGVMVRRSMISL